MLLIDTERMPADQRVDALRETHRSNLATVELTPALPVEQFRFVGSRVGLGPLVAHGVTSNGLEIERTNHMLGDGAEPVLTLSIQTAGTSLLEQQGRQATLSPGDVAAYVTTLPFVHTSARESRRQVFTVPLDHLALPRDVLNRATAVTFDANNAFVDLVRTFLAKVVVTTTADEHVVGHTLGRSATELVRALIVSELDDHRTLPVTAIDDLQVRILRYVDSHWSDLDLSAATIAAAHHISVRQLYSVLARAHVSLGESVRDRRLEACRDQLASLRSNTDTVAAVGRRWGFNDPTNFSRAFKSRYGITPRDWRALQWNQNDPG